MIRKMFGSMLVLAIAIGFVAAGEFQGRIMKVDGDTVTVQKIKGKGKKAENDGDPVKLKLAKDAKVVSGKADPDKKGAFVDGDDIKDGLKNEMFAKIGEKGVGALIVTEGEGDKEAITKIRVQGKKKKDAAE